MCGYCAEKIAIEIAERQTLGEALPPHLAHATLLYLQECERFYPALVNHESFLRDELAKIDQIEKSDQPEDFFEMATWATLYVVCGRLVEALSKKGFASPAYQALIDHPLAVGCIKRVQGQNREFDPRLFAADSIFRSLNYEDVFFDSTSWGKLLSDPQFLEHAIDLLDRYIKWWHEDNGGTDDLLSGLRSFYDAYPYLFLSYTAVVSIQPNHAIIREWVTAKGCVAFYENLALWLQRKAALVLHQNNGLDIFSPQDSLVQSGHGIGLCRPDLLCYLLVKRCLDFSERQLLRQSVHIYQQHRRESSIFNWEVESEPLPEWKRRPNATYAFADCLILDYLDTHFDRDE